MKTTGAAAKVSLAADRSAICADGSDLCFVTVAISDQDGLMVPRSNNLVKFGIAGPGEIIAVGSGDPTSHESFQTLERKAFNGLCLVVVRSVAGVPGTIKLSAKSSGLQEAEIWITTK